MIDLIAFGIIVDDIVFPQGYTRMGVLGGGGPQTAWGMAAARGSGATVGLAAGVGDDLDDAILEPLRSAGINLEGLRITDHPTPRAWQTVEFSGRRTQVWRVPLHTLGAQLGRSWDRLPDSCRTVRGMHWGIHPGEDRSLDFAREMHARGLRVSLEPFKASDQPLDDDALREILTSCTIFSPNMYETRRITGCDDYGAALDRFAVLGAQILVVRRGEDGADIWDMTAGEGVYVPAVQTEVADVVGAGNAFCGAFLARLYPDRERDEFSREDLREAACSASAAASYMVEQVGIPAALPDPADYARRVDQARAGIMMLSRDAI